MPIADGITTMVTMHTLPVDVHAYITNTQTMFSLKRLLPRFPGHPDRYIIFEGGYR